MFDQPRYYWVVGGCVLGLALLPFLVGCVVGGSEGLLDYQGVGSREKGIGKELLESHSREENDSPGSTEAVVAEMTPHVPLPNEVRAIYWTAPTALGDRGDELLAYMLETGLNAVVIDVKMDIKRSVIFFIGSGRKRDIRSIRM